ncbi:MAG: alanyl-tRNA editing protein [Acidobacteriota bacterium]
MYLDRTAFYPTSGGQLFDLGTLGGVAVTEIVDEDDRIAHVLDSPLIAETVRGEIDWTRRYGFMQLHTGQHLLSAVFEELFAWKTVSVHMGADSNTVDVDASAVEADQLARAERRCLEVIAEARPVTIVFEENAAGLRKNRPAAGRCALSPSTTSIAALAAEHTCARLRNRSRSHRQDRKGPWHHSHRIRVRPPSPGPRADNQRLAAISRTLSVSADQASDRIATLIDQNKILDKERQRLATELARREGHDLYAATHS